VRSVCNEAAEKTERRITMKKRNIYLNRSQELLGVFEVSQKRLLGKETDQSWLFELYYSSVKLAPESTISAKGIRDRLRRVRIYPCSLTIE
jgi:hypothetical protein